MCQRYFERCPFNIAFYSGQIGIVHQAPIASRRQESCTNSWCCRYRSSGAGGNFSGVSG